VRKRAVVQSEMAVLSEALAGAPQPAVAAKPAAAAAAACGVRHGGGFEASRAPGGVRAEHQTHWPRMHPGVDMELGSTLLIRQKLVLLALLCFGKTMCSILDLMGNFSGDCVFSACSGI